MKLFKLINNFKKQRTVMCLVLIFAQLFAPFTGFFGSSYIAKASEDSCLANTSSRPAISEEYGGVKLDKAATFLANMSDITGAYYDQSRNQIVFIGKTNTSFPQFNKDDLAVAIRAIIFNNATPAVSIDFKDLDNILGDPNMKVSYYGGIENTNFGKVLFDADLQLKRFIIGYNENGIAMSSSVPGYQSVLSNWIANGPNPNLRSASRWWISPKYITVIKDDINNSFVFDQVVMQVQSAALVAGNDPAWDKAAQDFATHQTQNFDAFANEIPSYAQTKQLGKITSVIKWLKDNQIATDYEWAKNYQPTVVPTPSEVARITSPNIISGNYYYYMTGGVEYSTPNTYNSDTQGSSASLKNASNSAFATSPDGIAWNFTSDGQNYQSIAVSADLFKSTGAYSYSQTDLLYPTFTKKTPLEITRNYSSFATDKNEGFGPGWSFVPATFTDLLPGTTVTCSLSQNLSFISPYKVAIITPYGRETFTYNNCASGYVPDDPSFHSKVARNVFSNNFPNTFIVKTKDNISYLFSAIYPSLMKIGEHNNTISFYRTDWFQDDNSGNKINFTRNTSNQIISATGPSGTVQYGYDSNGDLISVTDLAGNVTKYTYGSGHLLTSVVDKMGTTLVSNTYDSINRVVSQTNSNNIIRSVSYSNTEKSKTWIDSNNRTNKDFYDIKGNLIKNIDPSGAITTYIYGANSNMHTSVTDAKGNTTNFVYDAKGNLTSYTMPDGGNIIYTYDNNNRLLQQTDKRYTSTNGTAKSIINTYNAYGDLIQNNIADQTITTYNYTAQGKIASIKDNQGNTTSFTYNTQGLPISVQNPLGKVTNYGYDSSGRILQIQDPAGVITSFTYDANGNRLTATSPAGTIKYKYDNNGRLLSTTDTVSADINYAYDASGNLTAITDPSNGITSYTYDPYRNLIKSTDALNRNTYFSYDLMNRETSYKTPAGKTFTTQYDSLGNPIVKVTPNSITQNAFYDSLNRLKQAVVGNSTINYIYDAASRLTKVSGPTGSTSYSYDIKDRITQVTDSNNNIIKYDYDNIDNLTKITYPDGKIIQYQYDAVSHLTKVIDWNGEVTQYTYTTFDLLNSKILPNNIAETYTYDSANRLASITYSNSTQPVLFKQTYTRDARGFPTEIKEEGIVGKVGTNTYSYDQLGRLTSAYDYTLNATNTYAYDSVGNMVNTSIPSLTTTATNIAANTGSPTTVTTINATTATTETPTTANTINTVRFYSSSGDGSIYHNSSKIWTTTHDAVTGSSANSTSSSFNVSAGKTSSSKYKIERALLPFNTSAIPDDATITDAKLKLYVSAKVNNDNDGDDFVTVVNGTQPSTSTLSTKDYSTVGSINNPIEGIDKTERKDITNVAKNKFLIFNLNFAGKDFVSKTGFTKLGLREGHDMINSVFVGNAGKYNQLTVRTSEYAGTSSDPILEITYTIPTAPVIDTFTATPATIITGDSATLSWTLSGDAPTTLSIDNGVGNVLGTTSKTLSPTITTTYTLTATNVTGTFTKQVTVTVNPLAPVIDNFTATPETIIAGASSNLTWTLSSGTPTTLTIDNGIGSVLGTTSKIISPTVTTTYTITAINVTGTVTKQVTVTVNITLVTTSSNSYSPDNELTTSVKSNNGVTSTIANIYDAIGNLKSYTEGTLTKTFVWDDFNRLDSVKNKGNTLASFEYDALGNRIAKTNPSGTIRYVNDLTIANPVVLEETDASGTVNNVNVWGASGLISTGSSTSNQRLYPLTDAQGNTRFLTDSTGTVVQGFDFSPYGAKTSIGATATSPYLYNQENLDSETNLYFLRARYYDPSIGRFISRDPLRGTLTNPLSQNTYAYGLDNPMVYNDPSGKFVWDAIDVGFFLSSLKDFYNCPDWNTGGSFALDTVSLLPFIPSIGYITRADDAAKFSQKALDKAIDYATNPNKLTHIFKNTGHNLAPLVEKFGSQTNVIKAVINQLSDVLPQTSTSFRKVIVEVGDLAVTVSGEIMDGVIKIGTMYIK